MSNIRIKIMSKKKEVNSGDLVKVEPITDNQKEYLKHIKKVRMVSSLVVLVQEKHLSHCISLYKMF